MLIKSNQKKFVFLYFLVLSINPIISFVKVEENWTSFLISELLIIIVSILLYKYWNRKDILFKSTETGIIVSGSKEGMYDPDYIAYSDISDCIIDGNRIIIESKANKKIILINLGKNLHIIFDEINAHI